LKSNHGMHRIGHKADIPVMPNARRTQSIFAENDQGGSLYAREYKMSQSPTDPKKIKALISAMSVNCAKNYETHRFIDDSYGKRYLLRT